jgi:hypothetical protein
MLLIIRQYSYSIFSRAVKPSAIWYQEQIFMGGDTSECAVINLYARKQNKCGKLRFEMPSSRKNSISSWNLLDIRLIRSIHLDEELSPDGT